MASIEVSNADIWAHLPGASQEVVEQLIAGTMARAGILAPCLLTDTLTAPVVAAARDILISVVVRAIEVSGGEVTTLIAGPMQQTMDTTKRRAQRFRPDEIRELQHLCGIKRGGAFTITQGYDAYDAMAEDWTPDAP